ncbi:prostate and testis expressed protein 4-like [Apodemus sylvaticus]|uniref:prostate and testis expressed protein 4-like n=1 Tax=Apodemus sylvaticus TaxID=10129 RepID=UPI002242FEDC|nr:prostate and testis expressed protein 4-like [Apodemus sylvaticus]
MNAVMKIGTLLIVTLSCLCIVEGLICNVCKKSQNSKCKENRSQCVAKAGESCYSTSYYYGTNHVFSHQGCQYKCQEGELKRGQLLTYIMCCDKNLCNSF